MKESTIADIIDAQIEQQGLSVIRVSDVHVLTFTTKILEKLVKASRESGRVIVFAKHGVQQ